MLDELKEGLALKSVARVLKLYATALSGREVAIRGTNELAAVEAYGDDHIILPPEMRFFEEDAANFTAYKVATAHGAGRIEFGTYGFSLADIPQTVARLQARYPGSMSTLRITETDLTRFYALFPQPALARDLFNIVEGHRVDTLIRRAYPGIVKDMRLIQVASAERRPTIAHSRRRPGGGRVAAPAHARPAAGPGRRRPATAALIGRAIAMLGEVEREGASVGERRRAPPRLYELIDDGLADPGRQLTEGADGAPPEDAPGEAGEARRPPRPRAPAAPRTTSRSRCRPS